MKTSLSVSVRLVVAFLSIFCSGVLFKFLLFDAIWCFYTTFTPFSCWETYATAATAALVLSIPYVLSGRPVVNVIVMAALDVWMVCNLMYYRTYYTAIPPSSYLLAGNLEDFMPAVAASLRWCDVLFPASTLVFALSALRKGKRQRAAAFPFRRRTCFALLTCLCLLLGIHFHTRGGFLREYEDIQTSAHSYASGTPLYTLFGTLYFDYAEEQPELTEEQEREINAWLAGKPELMPLEGAEGRDNCIVIFVESLESWVMNLTVEGQEIMPCINRLLKEPTTLYAPRVLTQVGGGRSIDAQLLILAGMLPLQTGSYSSRYPDNLYYTLPKAMKEMKGTRNYLLTVDKSKTWNQERVAHSFGIDTLLSYPDFRLTEAFGNRKRVGDRSFFAQCREKMERGEVWPAGERAFIQMVTYSGHSPFKMPDELKAVHFSDQIPEMMADYMTVTHYTDEAIGRFVEYLKTRPDYDRTLIVITGDHEGLADNRKGLCRSAAGEGVVSDKEFTPLIVVNAPVPMQYDKVMGQVDIYPTLLNLLGLEAYRWGGFGQSIFDPQKPAVAIGSRRQLEGDTLSVPTGGLMRIRQAPAISDRMIRFNKFQQE